MRLGIVLGIVLVILVSIAAICFLNYKVAYDTGNRLEQTIKATYENNRNILAQYGNRVAEAAQIPGMQRDDLTAVVTAALEGRYGTDGSRAVVQFIQEQNPQIDSSVYVQLQRIIEAGRNEFSAAQTKLIDQKRIYETSLGSFWTGMWMKFAGYPKINLDDYQIVSTGRADEAFETGIEEAIDLTP